ncbi:hypothetical protein QBC32DRAFT_52275 [Pseudoneurospora amorphoporcata]|uniref:Uncharacterized protein n=1 Tax=Pseudoneurospora amorphoporcata TaxID=241081 RepID=A0AAN6SCL6_9PEZI|nr:hypothetical protein QBC32DRAFT_52275 [Pseudoneurospora amorphoporcata]
MARKCPGSNASIRNGTRLHHQLSHHARHIQSPGQKGSRDLFPPRPPHFLPCLPSCQNPTLFHKAHLKPEHGHEVTEVFDERVCHKDGLLDQSSSSLNYRS